MLRASSRRFCICLLCLLLGTLVAPPSWAQAPAGESIFGRELMSERERQEHRERMRRASSDEERERIRREHHERMRKRAAKQGVDLPAAPPPSRRRAGDGPGKARGR